VAVEVSLRRAIGNLRAAIEEAGAAVTYDALPTIEADDLQLTQLFQNLIGNALKFRSTSVPRIHISSKERENEWEFAVQDNGIGIEPAYFERIFMVFQRLHNKGEYPGTGIGLAICKKVVERHGGSIRVESALGEGASFNFHAAQETGGVNDGRTKRAHRHPAGRGPPGRRAPHARGAGRKARSTATLHWVKDGVEALEFLRRQGKFAGSPRPDIILLDLNLPKKDGREVLSEITSDDKLSASRS